MKYIIWFAFKIEGTNVDRINLAAVYELGATLHTLTKLTPDKRYEILTELHDAERHTKSVLTNYPDLATCQSRGRELLNLADKAETWLRELITRNKTINKKDANSNALFTLIVKRASEFENTLLADLEQYFAFHPSQQNISLIEFSPLFSDKTLLKFDDKIKQDVEESKRCLLFECYTAFGFHILRFLESVTYEYYLKVGGKPLKAEDRVLGQFIATFDKLFKDQTTDTDIKKHVKTVRDLLQLIKDNDRNLIMHPEKTLTRDDAIFVGDKCKVAAETMAQLL